MRPGRLVRPWTTLAWCFLTCGIAWRLVGVPSWGGADGGLGPGRERVVHAAAPRHRAGHSLAVTEARRLPGWTVLLATHASSMSLLGTFLALWLLSTYVPSPRIKAQHFLSGSRARHRRLAGFAWRAPRGGLAALRGFSRESMLLASSAARGPRGRGSAGPLYPRVLDALNLGKIGRTAVFREPCSSR